VFATMALAIGLVGMLLFVRFAYFYFSEDAPTGHVQSLFVGGDFQRAGSTEVQHIARWDGAAWAPVGGGVAFWGAFRAAFSGAGLCFSWAGTFLSLAAFS